MFVCMCVGMNVYVCIYVCICVYICIYVYICVYLYILMLSENYLLQFYLSFYASVN